MPLHTIRILDSIYYLQAIYFHIQRSYVSTVSSSSVFGGEKIEERQNIYYARSHHTA